jgi:hypothetical protein
MPKNHKVWLVEDKGNDHKIYEVSITGKRLREFKQINGKIEEREEFMKDERRSSLF